MPFVIDRRHFLKAGAGALLSLQAMRASDTSLSIALFSDTHTPADPSDSYRGFFPQANLKKAVAQASQVPYDLLIVNGDLARRQGLPADYAQFIQLMDPLLERGPIAITMGNHDDRKNAAEALAKRAGALQPVESKLVSSLDAGAYRFVFLDSLLVTNVTQGQLGHLQRDWLAHFLDSQRDKPVVVFVHHNPNEDEDTGLVDADRLLAILRPRRWVKALIFGHTHIYNFDQSGDLPLINLPAIGYNFQDGVPIGWVHTSFSPSGAHFQFHALTGNLDAGGSEHDITWRPG